MYSLWNEASRDVERENRLRRIALADAEIDSGLFSFVALSQSREEYNHRKALVEDRISAIAEKTGATVDEVIECMDKKVGYLLEAAELARSAADDQTYVVVDSNDAKLGGPYGDKESAQRAVEYNFADTPGVRIIPAGSYGGGKRASVEVSAKKSTPEQDDIPIHERDQYFSVLSSLRNSLMKSALEEGDSVLEFAPHLPVTPGGVEGENSEHSEDSDPGAHLPGGNIPEKKANTDFLTPPGIAGAPTDDTMNPMAPSTTPGAPMPGVNQQQGPGADAPGVGDALKGMMNSSTTVNAMKSEIAKYNPHLSPERIESIAHAVAERYFH